MNMMNHTSIRTLEDEISKRVEAAVGAAAHADDTDSVLALFTPRDFAEILSPPPAQASLLPPVYEALTEEAREAGRAAVGREREERRGRERVALSSRFGLKRIPHRK